MKQYVQAKSNSIFSRFQIPVFAIDPVPTNIGNSTIPDKFDWETKIDFTAIFRRWICSGDYVFTVPENSMAMEYSNTTCFQQHVAS